MENLIVIVIVATIVAAALWYIRREKKRGKKCVGCPYANQCSGNCSCK